MKCHSARGGPPAAPCSFEGSRLDGKLQFWLLAGLLLLWPGASCRADSADLSVTANVLSRNICKFESNNAVLNFGALDPGNAADVVANASVSFVCRGSAPVAIFSVADDDGLYATGPDANRMRHASVPTEFLPYRLALAPTTGSVPKNARQTLTISGTVRGTDYRNAAAGNYSDTVVISLLP